MYAPHAPLKLTSSVSEQNVYYTYVCLFNEITPNSFSNQSGSYGFLDPESEEVDQDEAPIQVERSKAVHELIETKNKDKHEEKSVSDEEDPRAQTTSDEGEKSDLDDFIELNGNQNILKLTKMKWLTEDQCNSPDSSSPSLSPNISSTSICSKDSDSKLMEYTDKYLSTILRLDREHNMFGLSNLAIVGSQPTWRPRRDDDRPVFLQTAIVQVCCTKGCCRNMSKTDLPASLKCGGCHSCCAPICYRPSCPTCCADPPCPHAACPPAPKCISDCRAKCFGLQVAVRRKPKYEPTPMELTPRSSCVLQKPFAARSCHHIPRCVPPSSVFPYLMPCFWPARPSAPCSVPTRCFHNPPCLPPRKRRPPNMPSDTCPPKCDATEAKCQNLTCLGKSPSTKQALETRYGKK